MFGNRYWAYVLIAMLLAVTLLNAWQGIAPSGRSNLRMWGW